MVRLLRQGQPNGPTTPVSTLKTAWTTVRDNAKVVGRWHDNCHTLVTELAESGAGGEVIMSIAGHVSRAMLSATPTWGWKRNGAPLRRSLHPSGRQTKGARRKPSSGSRVRW